MARIKYTYKSFPNSPRATEYSKDREAYSIYLGGLVGLFDIGAVIAFFVYSFSLFSDGNFGGFLIALLSIILAAYFLAYIIELRQNNTEYQLKVILLEESVVAKQHYYKVQMKGTLDKETRQEALDSLKKYYIEQSDTLKKENRKKNREFLKKYFRYFFLGLFVAISVVGIIQGLFL